MDQETTRLSVYAAAHSNQELSIGSDPALSAKPGVTRPETACPLPILRLDVTGLFGAGIFWFSLLHWVWPPPSNQDYYIFSRGIL